MLKLIANTTMVIDHFGYCFFPAQMWIRAIGRISMPLFALGIANGYKHTKEKGTTNQYLIRLLLFSAISQLPYNLMVQRWLAFNIGWAYVAALLLLMIFDKDPIVGVFASMPVLALSVILRLDGSMFSILAVLQCYFFIVKPGYKQWGWIACMPLHFLWAYMISTPVWALASLSYPLAYILRKYDHKVKLPRKLAYSIYPVHIAVFGFLRAALPA